MRPFEVLETTDLVSVLAEYTARYSKMMTRGRKRKRHHQLQGNYSGIDH